MSEEPQQPTDIWPPYLADPAVNEAMGLAKDVAVWNEERIYGLEVQCNDQSQMAITAFAMVHEHHRACVHLTTMGLLSPATAMMRPMFDVFVRGMWLQWANEDELQRFRSGEDSLNLERAIKLVAVRSGEKRYNDMQDTWLSSKKTLHGFVHHSYQSIIRRHGEVQVDNEEVASLLNFSTGMAIHASLEILEIAERGALPDRQQATIAVTRSLQWELLPFFTRMGLAEPKEA